MKQVVRVHERDNVATAVEAVAAGETIQVTGVGPSITLTAVTPVPQGHKVALVAISAGEVVVKYGEPIGRATAAIAAGECVHTHNLEGLRGRQGQGR
jgi:altronate dehydratase small subunit